MRSNHWGSLFLLALLWGSSFFFYKVLVAALPPVTVVLGRVAIAAIAMNLWLVAQRQGMAPTPFPHQVPLAGFPASGPFSTMWCPSSWSPGAKPVIESGMASILNATTPIFMVAVAHWGTEDEKLSWNNVLAIACGILGVVVLVGAEAFGGAGNLWGALAVVGASCAYGFGGVYSRRFKDLPPLVAATGQITGAAILMLPLSLLIDHPWTCAPPGGGVWRGRLASALVNTALAYVVYYRILAGTGAIYVSLVTFLIPPVALLLGAAAFWAKRSRSGRSSAWRSSGWAWRRSTGG